MLIAIIVLSPAGRAAAEGGIEIGVLRSEGSAEISARQAEIITDILSWEISAAEGLTAVKMGTPGPADLDAAVAAGMQAGLKHVLLWTLRDLSDVDPLSSLSGNASQDRAAKRDASATIDARVVDVPTSGIFLGFSEIGRSGGYIDYSSADMDLGPATDEFGESKAKAIASAAALLERGLMRAVSYAEPAVSAVSGGEYVINIGSSAKVRRSNLYLAYSESADGKVPLGILKVDSVKRDRSVTTLAPPSKSGLILLGDKIEPIRPRDAENVKLAANRASQPPREPEVLPGNTEVVSADELEERKEPEDAKTSSFADIEAAYIQTASSDDSQAAAERGEVEHSEAEGMKEGDGRVPVRERVNLAEGQAGGDIPPGGMPVLRVDPNLATGTEVIGTFPLSPIDKSNLEIQHLNAWRLYSRDHYAEAFDEFRRLAQTYRGNYLSAYWAGMAALKLNDKKTAAVWFKHALNINPNYKPALEAMEMTA
jgi:TolA-binding protein